MVISRRLALVAIMMTASATLSAQAITAPVASPQAAAPLPAYDVVSIKPNNSGSGGQDIDSSNGDYAATNVSIKTLLENAYDIKENLISGISGPISSARFDVHAKIVEPDITALHKLTIKQRRSMLLPFLQERFHLKAHIEMKTLSVFELTVTKDGPKFKPSVDSAHGGGTSIQNDNNKAKLTAHAVSMVSFASTLTNWAHRTVIDKTGLTGLYDLALQWSQQDLPGQDFTNRSNSSPPPDSGPSIFTALQEQLGLKLKPAKGPVETLVVDHVEMPSAN
jgi:uncharacterized protein (TIGR03435 family)